MALAIADSNGIKRICTNCGTRYYDMGKTPVTCPSCDTEYVGQLKPKVIESVDPKEEDEKAVDVAEKTDDADEDEDDAVVSLDDLATDEDEGDDVDEATALDNGDVVDPKSDK